MRFVCMEAPPARSDGGCGYKSFLAGIGLVHGAWVEFVAALPNVQPSHLIVAERRGRGADSQRFLPVRFFTPALRWRGTARRKEGSPAVRGRATSARPFIRGRPASPHDASAFCNRVTQYSQARSTPRSPRLWAPHFSASPGDSGSSFPIAVARSCSSALRVV